MTATATATAAGAGAGAFCAVMGTLLIIAVLRWRWRTTRQVQVHGHGHGHEPKYRVSPVCVDDIETGTRTESQPTGANDNPNQPDRQGEWVEVSQAKSQLERIVEGEGQGQSQRGRIVQGQNEEGRRRSSIDVRGGVVRGQTSGCGNPRTSDKIAQSGLSSRLESKEWNMEEVDIETEAEHVDGLRGSVGFMYASGDPGIAALSVQAQAHAHSQTPSSTDFRYRSLVPAPLSIRRHQQRETQPSPDISGQLEASTPPDSGVDWKSGIGFYPHPLKSHPHPHHSPARSDSRPLPSNEAGGMQQDSGMHQNPTIQSPAPFSASHHAPRALAPRRRYHDSIIDRYMTGTHPAVFAPESTWWGGTCEREIDQTCSMQDTSSSGQK